jgi:hypothetical protein
MTSPKSLGGQNGQGFPAESVEECLTTVLPQRTTKIVPWRINSTKVLLKRQPAFLINQTNKSIDQRVGMS